MFTVFLTLTNCQTDDHHNHDEQGIQDNGNYLKYLSGDEAQQAIQLLKNAMGGSTNMKSNGWTIDFSDVLLVKDSLSNVNYTYRITHPKMRLTISFIT